jgi:uncharacterized protein (TIGR02271 family)
MSDAETTAFELSEERAHVGTVTEETGRVRARKSVEHERVEQVVARGTEHADLERRPVAAEDSGEVETLPDGSVSIPVFEEQLVVTKRLVVRERVILRKHTVYEDHLVQTELRKERLDIEADPQVALTGDTSSS